MIAPQAKYVFERGDVRSLRETIRRAIASRLVAENPNENGQAVLYDASVAGHVDALLSLASQVHTGWSISPLSPYAAPLRRWV